MIPIQPPVDFRALFAVEDQRLLGLLRSLSTEQWKLPTPCPGWDVHGLALHLLGGSFGVISWLRDGFRGNQPPDGVSEGGFITWLDELQASWVDAARRVSPLLLVELLEWSTARFDEALQTQDPTAQVAHVSWASDQPVPVWLDHARELSEKWIHRQQLLESIGEPVDLRPDLAGPVLGALRLAYPHRLNAEPRERGSFVAIDIAGGAMADQWTLVCDGVTWTFEGADRTTLLATMTMSADQAWRLLTNNYRVSAHGPIEMSGDERIVSALARTRAIIGAPK